MRLKALMADAEVMEEAEDERNEVLELTIRFSFKLMIAYLRLTY